MSRLFGHGDLRLWLLKLLDEEPRHGYDIIAGLEEQFLGVYSPSPGTVYPRLQALEQEGLIEVVREEEGRKIYGLTAAGREELEERTSEIRELGEHLARSAKEIARDIRQDVKESVRHIRREILEAAREVRRDERRASRRHDRHERRNYGAARHAARDVSTELRSVLRSLQRDLDGFVNDVVSAARSNNLDRSRLASLRDALSEARSSVMDALEGKRRQGDPPKDD